MTYEDQIVEQVERGNDLEVEVKWLKSDEYVNGIKADALEDAAGKRFKYDSGSYKVLMLEADYIRNK